MFTNYQPTDEDQHRKAKVTEREEQNLPPFENRNWAIKSLKDRKSPGCDDIQAERIKTSGEEGLDILSQRYGKVDNGPWSGKEQFLYHCQRRETYSYALTTEQYH